MKIDVGCVAALALCLSACQPPSFPDRETPGSRQADLRGEATSAACSDWRQAQLEHPIDALLGNPTPAGRFGLGCSLTVDLQRMIVTPAELTVGGTTGPATSAGFSGAVGRYNKGDIVPLPEPSLHTLGAGG